MRIRSGAKIGAIVGTVIAATTYVHNSMYVSLLAAPAWLPMLWLLGGPVSVPSLSVSIITIMVYTAAGTVAALIAASWKDIQKRWAQSSRRRRRSLGRCEVCNYDLTGNTTGICSECGNKVEDEQCAW